MLKWPESEPWWVVTLSATTPPHSLELQSAVRNCYQYETVDACSDSGLFWRGPEVLDFKVLLNCRKWSVLEPLAHSERRGRWRHFLPLCRAQFATVTNLKPWTLAPIPASFGVVLKVRVLGFLELPKVAGIGWNWSLGGLYHARV